MLPRTTFRGRLAEKLIRTRDGFRDGNNLLSESCFKSRCQVRKLVGCSVDRFVTPQRHVLSISVGQSSLGAGGHAIGEPSRIETRGLACSSSSMRRKDVQEVIDALLAISLGLGGPASGLVSC